jgi:hypothetical protein
MTDPGGRAEVRALLGEDVVAALAALGAEATSATRVTGLPSPIVDRATFRVALGDGRVVKARRLSRAAKAARFTRLVNAVADPRLPAILVVAGRVVVEEWIDGASLVDLPLDAARLARAGDLLGSLHARASLGEPRRHGFHPTRRLVKRTKRHLAQLAAAGLLARADAAALVDGLRSFAPAEAIVGLTHNDFCAANLVEDARGRLLVVDNEGLRIGFLDFDLARTWYRWPMPGEAWAAFLGRYATWRDPAPALARAPFWRIAVVAKSVHLRMIRGAEPATASRRLSALARDLRARLPAAGR